MPAHCVPVSGEIDCASAPEYAAILEAAARLHDGDLVLDFGAVTFADSTCVRLTLEARAKLAESGRTLRIVNATRIVRVLFEVTGVDEMLQSELA